LTVVTQPGHFSGKIQTRLEKLSKTNKAKQRRKMNPKKPPKNAERKWAGHIKAHVSNECETVP